MNYGISILFRAIPLLMALFCFGYGAFVLHEGLDSAKFVAGPVVFSLGMICIALFATAATIIRQIIHTYNPIARYVLPVIGYLAAVLTVIYGWNYMHETATASNFVAGHVICGVGFITACVATTATASTRFTLIPANSERTDQLQPADAFNSSQGYILIAVATLMAVMAWIWAFWLLSKSSEHNAYYVAGHVMAGLACICSSLVALVATIVRQIRNNYTKSERETMAGPCFDNGQHQHSLGTSGLGQQQSGTLLHRIYYDRPGTGMLQHFQQSHTTCRHLAEHFQAGQPHPADSGLHGPGLSVSLRLSV